MSTRVVGIAFLVALLLGAETEYGRINAKETAQREGAFEARLMAIARDLKSEKADDKQCEMAFDMRDIAPAWPNIRQARDETIKALTDLISNRKYEGQSQCPSEEAAYVLGWIGPRAGSAVPLLEQALAEELVAEAKRKPAFPELDWGRSRSSTLRWALNSIKAND